MPIRSLSDEAYVIDLCDAVLGRPTLGQHRYDFLRGDARAGSPETRLPVDAYYPDKQLVVEYRERQHGVDRGAQRTRYDQRRRDVLPQHDIALVELSYADFADDKYKCLCRRRPEDLATVRQALVKWIR